MSKEELRKKLYGMTTQIHDGDAYQQSIWQAIADALEPIDRTVKETVDGIFIDKSTWELDFWEELYGLEPLGSVEDRKSAVKSNIRMNPTMTTEVFENIVSSWKGAEVEVEEFYDEYRIEVRFTDPNETPDDMDALVDFMYEILPAHLAMSVGYKYIRIKDVHNKLTSEQMERLAMSTFATPEDYEVDGGYYTDRLDLYNRDPIDDADRLFDLQAMLNDNWDKIDKNVALLKDLDKHINNKNNPHNVTSDQVTTIKRMPSDARLRDYPDGVTVFYTNVTDEGYPHRYGNVLTVTGQSGTTGFQLFALNNFNASRRKIYVRYYHGDADKGWSDWFKLADSLDLDELKSNIDDLNKKDVGLGNVDNVKQATKAEFDNHKEELGNYQNAGHVKLSNATNSQASVSDGVAATPKAVKDAYDYAGDAHTKISKHADNKNNPHDVTKSQVGLGNVANYKIATEAQAMAGTSNTAYMTPLRTSQYVKEISGENAAGVLAELNKHKGDNNNPHNVTKSQVGLGKVTNDKQATKTEFDAHANDKTNPHGVTKSQVGLGNVANYSTATQTEAEAGTATNKYMTPKTTADAIKKQAGDAVKGHTEDYNNPHKVTKSQVGLGDVANYKVASKSQAEEATSNNTYMTPLRVLDFLKANGVNSVAGVKRDKDGNVPLTIADLTMDDYLPPTAPPRDYPVGITSFRTNATQAKEWGDLVGDSIVNTRFLVMTVKASSVWQSAQFIFGVDGYANTGNTIRHRNLYVRSTMASNQSTSNDWSAPIKIVDDRDLSDAIKKLTKSDVGLGNVDNVKQATKTEFDAHANDKTNPHGVTKSQVGLGNVDNVKQATKTEFDKHTNDKSNPHAVTKTQIGLGNVDNIKQASKSEFDAHTNDKNNPHNVTKSQVGLGNVANYSTATQTEAEAGTATNKYMTPKTTADAIKKQAGDAVKGHAEDYNNPHKVTKAQVGLGNVTNVKQATKAEFDTHTNNKANPHNVTKSQVGLGNVDNVKQASKTEFDRHASYIGNFGSAGHVKLSNHTTSENSVGDGVAATPLAVKTVNDRIDNLDSELHNDITWIGNNAHTPDDTPDQYPEGVTIFKTTIQTEWDKLVGMDTDARYFITTYRNRNINVVYQKIVRMRRRTTSDTDFDGMWIRTAFRVDLPWSDPIRVDIGDTVIAPKDSDAPFTDYPLGVSVFYTNAGDSGYPNRIVTVMTVRDDDRTAFQFSARNGYADVSKHMWYRIGHYQTGWSEWYQIADNRDIDEVKGLVEQAQKTADEAISKIPKLSSSVTSTSTSVGANSYAVKQAYDRASEALQAGVKQKQATADSLTSIGASLPSDPTWEELQDEIKKADYNREARVELDKGQTKVPLDFYPEKASGRAYLYDRYSHLVVADKNDFIPNHVGTVYSAVPGLDIGATEIKAYVRAVGKSIEVVDKDLKPKPLPVAMVLYIYGVAKK